MKKGPLYAMLSFDTEEFVIPAEQKIEIPFEQIISVSKEGTEVILDTLKQAGVPATFFCTTNLLLHAPSVGKRIVEEGHEMASHGCDHRHPLPEHVIQSKPLLEEAFGVTIRGYRQPQMFPVNNITLREQGYLYNSSLNPAFIPGRYMHLTTPRTAFWQDGVLQIPASVTPWVRFPLFWLAEHHLPQIMYEALVMRTLRHDGYFNTYFHPWEFVAINKVPAYGIPYIIGHRCGSIMQQRLAHLIARLQKEDVQFITYTQFYEMFSGHSQDH